jgi:hypothetical protein
VFAEMSTVAFSEGNPNWLDFRREFRGREGKYYWQDVPTLHDCLSQLLNEAKDLTEATVVRTVKSMLDPEPTSRPDAANLTMTFTPAPCCLSWPNEKASYPGPLEESASVEMIVHEDGIDCCAQFHLHGDSDNKQLCGPVAHAKNWLDKCSHDHDACRQGRNNARALPTRLVDIRPDNVAGSFVRIVDSAQLDSGCGSTDYVSLGYFWNQNEPVLATDCLQAMQNELSRELLPRALNKAISAAERIGYRYIWVDSLCVLQDSEEDKERECLATPDVYRNSALTIVLDQLQSSIYDQANIHEGSRRRADGIQSPCRPPGGTDNSAAAHTAIDFQTPGFGWDTRAWSLQERFLSPRHLHLGEEQMYWECNALKASETFPLGLPPLLWEKVHTRTTPAGTAQLPQYSIGHKPSAHLESEASNRNVMTNPELPNSCLRNQQRIRKEGNGIGDPMQAQLQREFRAAYKPNNCRTNNVESKSQEMNIKRRLLAQSRASRDSRQGPLMGFNKDASSMLSGPLDAGETSPVYNSKFDANNESSLVQPLFKEEVDTCADYSHDILGPIAMDLRPSMLANSSLTSRFDDYSRDLLYNDELSQVDERGRGTDRGFDLNGMNGLSPAADADGNPGFVGLIL